LIRPLHSPENIKIVPPESRRHATWPNDRSNEPALHANASARRAHAVRPRALHGPVVYNFRKRPRNLLMDSKFFQRTFCPKCRTVALHPAQQPQDALEPSRGNVSISHFVRPALYNDAKPRPRSLSSTPPISREPRPPPTPDSFNQPRTEPRAPSVHGLVHDPHICITKHFFAANGAAVQSLAA
jgi:hypothetical protein